MSASLKRIDPSPRAENSPAEVKQAPAAAEPAAIPTALSPTVPAKRNRGRRVLMLSLPLAIALAGGWYWLTGGRYIETDNAYVHQALVPLSADISGRIAEVDVVQNQRVTAGTVLFRLDPEPFQIALDQAKAAVDQARLTIGQQRAAYHVAEAELSAANDALEVRQSEYDRQSSMLDRGVSTPAALDEALLSLRAAQSEVDLARQKLAQAAALLGGDPEAEVDSIPSVRAALAAQASAQRDLDQTVVKAPADGLIAQVGNLNVGQFVSEGVMVVSLVATDKTWIEANFKETQIAALLPGQKVEVGVDAYPGYTLDGVVGSFSGATGSQFSLIPAQNATGNWVKVVQRLPVRVEVHPDADHPMRDGMSVVVSVDSGTSRLDRMR